MIIDIKKSKRQTAKWIRKVKTLLLRDLFGLYPIFGDYFY